jgi:hypothetical protein
LDPDPAACIRSPQGRALSIPVTRQTTNEDDSRLSTLRRRASSNRRPRRARSPRSRRKSKLQAIRQPSDHAGDRAVRVLTKKLIRGSFPVGRKLALWRVPSAFLMGTAPSSIACESGWLSSRPARNWSAGKNRVPPLARQSERLRSPVVIATQRRPNPTVLSRGMDSAGDSVGPACEKSRAIEPAAGSEGRLEPATPCYPLYRSWP